MAGQEVITGGCQCGAVRFRIRGGLGRASICHCRMCQKAFGGFFGPLVTAFDVEWVKAQPSHFRSSNKARRGFCPSCGTPLTFEVDGADAIDIAIGTLDQPELAPPAIQVGLEGKLGFVASLESLPIRSADEEKRVASHYAGIISCQHADHD